MFEKEDPPRVKPLLYVYRVLLTGIYLMRTGEIEANLVTSNESFRLPYVPELIERKVHGTEAQTLDGVERQFHASEYARLTMELERAGENSPLPETTDAAGALDDLLVRVRIGTVC